MGDQGWKAKLTNNKGKHWPWICMYKARHMEEAIQIDLKLQTITEDGDWTVSSA